MKTGFLIFACFISALFLNMKMVEASDYRVISHSIAPFSIHSENKKVTGFAADLYSLVFQNVPQAPDRDHIYQATFKRLYADLQSTKRSIGLVVGKNAKREKLFKWVGPYLTIHLGVVGKKDNNTTIGSVEDLKKYKIATIENTAPEQALLNLGLKMNMFERDIYPKRILLKLHHDRVDLMAYPLQALSYLMQKEKITAFDYEEVFPIRKIQLYFAFSQDFKDEEIALFQRNLDSVMASDAYTELKKRYVLDGIQKYGD